MQDRYLFKAKRKDNGEWVEGYYFKRKIYKDSSAVEHFIMTSKEPKRGRLCKTIFFAIDPSTICQCTGRKDEWEHDVFQSDDERYEIQFCKDSLTWEAVSIFSSESIELGEFSPSEYVRIGNSIDNPELLGVGE